MWLLKSFLRPNLTSDIARRWPTFPMLNALYWNIQCGAVITRSNFSQNTSHSSPVRARYGMYFVGSNRDLYSVSVTVVIGAISCHIGPRYNGTRLYWGRNKTVAIFQKTFSNAISWMNCRSSQMAGWKYVTIISDSGLAPYRRQAIATLNDLVR